MLTVGGTDLYPFHRSQQLHGTHQTLNPLPSHLILMRNTAEFLGDTTRPILWVLSSHRLDGIFQDILFFGLGTVIVAAAWQLQHTADYSRASGMFLEQHLGYSPFVLPIQLE